MNYILPPLQRGYIDGPILNTFHTNLVVLPAVMEYMQYGLIALGLATIIIAAIVHHRVKVRPPHSRQAVFLMYLHCMLHCSMSCPANS